MGGAAFALELWQLYLETVPPNLKTILSVLYALHNGIVLAALSPIQASLGEEATESSLHSPIWRGILASVALSAIVLAQTVYGAHVISSGDWLGGMELTGSFVAQGEFVAACLLLSPAVAFQVAANGWDDDGADSSHVGLVAAAVCVAGGILLYNVLPPPVLWYTGHEVTAAFACIVLVASSLAFAAVLAWLSSAIDRFDARG